MKRTALLVSLTVLLGACAQSPVAPVAPGPATAPTPTPTPVAATPPGPAAGQWQLVIEVDDLPGTGKVPPQTMTMCSTPEDKRQWQDMVGGKVAAGCSVKDYRATGATISYAMQCAGGIEGATVITVQDENSYRGESTMTLRAGEKPAVIRSKVTAKRLGATCAK